MIDTYKRESGFSELKKFCGFAKEDDYIELTNWYNGEGIDICVNDRKKISLTWGEWDCINAIMKILNPDEDGNQEDEE